MLLDDLDQVAASVVEHGGGHRSHGCRRLGKADPGGTEPGVLALAWSSTITLVITIFMGLFSQVKRLQ